MAKSRFKPEHQNSDLNLKVVAGLERLGEVFKHLLWEQAKIHGLSPIQIQILLFTDQHKAEYNTVSYLALELSVTKATISDAVRVLVKKELLQKIPSVVDQRSYWLKPTPKTETLLAEFTQYDQAIISEVKRLDEATKENLFQALSQVISSLNKKEIIKVQRNCQACKFLNDSGNQAYCNLLELPLKSSDYRLDCPEFEAALS